MHIIQFTHPGAEFLVSAVNSFPHPNGEYDVRWNTRNHCRRLVKHIGSYIDEFGVLQEGELVFWTEWEGPSSAVKLGGANEVINAKYLHRVKYPVFINDRMDNGAVCCQNTDPCVFGDSFKYSVCRQDSKPILRNLQNGSLIAFVSMINKTYYLDTLFVVGESQHYSTDNTTAVNCSDEYRALTLDRLDAHKTYTFYRGRRFLINGENSIYSFAPAKCYTGVDNQKDFERCALNVNAINTVVGKDVFTNGNLSGIKKTEVTADEVSSVWNAIVRQVKTGGFVRGVHFDWPSIHNK